MARIYKISGYYIDIDGCYNDDGLQAELEERFDLIDKHIKVESVDIVEWDDDNPLNFLDSKEEECEKWFRSTANEKEAEEECIPAF